jgi:predicted DCC family thiol-disulfide oxidoreductase YuxK
MIAEEAAPGSNWLLYDGECPFCSSYVHYVRLRDTAGPVMLADARKYPALVAEAKALGFDVDVGMVLKLDGQYYFGGDCIHALSLLTTSSGVFNRMNRALFKSKTVARVAYPLLRAGRNFALFALGRRRIDAGAAARMPENQSAVGARDGLNSRGGR